MAVRRKWLADAIDYVPVGELSRFAFDATIRLLSTKDRPDALVVMTDDLFVGTLCGIMAIGLRVPEDLRLVVCHNQELDLPCPVPCYFVEPSLAEAAKGMADTLQALAAGGKPKQLSVENRLRRYVPTTTEPHPLVRLGGQR